MDLFNLTAARIAGRPRAIVSVCSAHPLVLRAALRFCAQAGHAVLIEATCNQVNHQGGYTGMTPADFAHLAREIAQAEGCAELILGGDHLGPNPWRDLPAEAAMEEACAMVQAYVRAGFTKLHLDASMGCAGEPPALSDDLVAGRAVRLALAAEAAATAPLCYIIGTEVPPPGGADHALSALTPTEVDAARTTLRIHRAAFAEAGLDFERVLGLVVQPGVEFGNHNVIPYDPAPARALVGLLAGEPRLLYEAHSTDYQGVERLGALVADGFGVLKVGPELTHVLREALYALDLIASDLVPSYGQRPLMRAMEAKMLAAPADWARHYAGADAALLRHYSYSDRIRYYWPKAETEVAALFAALKGRLIPAPLMAQHFPAAIGFCAAPLEPESLVIWRVTQSLAAYQEAANGAV